jgi:cell division protein FtsI (penicillin-binding protein 3)
VYASDPQMFDIMNGSKFASNSPLPSTKLGHEKAKQKVYNAFGMRANNKLDTQNGFPDHGIKYTEGIVPDVLGMGLKDALFTIGNAGLKPLVSGSGKVIKQSIDAGLRAEKGQMITLQLQQ